MVSPATSVAEPLSTGVVLMLDCVSTVGTLAAVS